MTAKLPRPPFTNEEWARDGDAWKRKSGTDDDRWTYDKERELYRWACADDQWNAVLTAVPDEELARADLDAARAEFNEAGSDYLSLIFYHRARFAKGSPVRAWRKRRKYIEAALLGIEEATNLSYQDHLKRALYFADAAIAAFEMQGQAHRGRKSPERDWLYARLLNIWVTRFNRNLTTGRPSNAKAGKREANSPAIRFLRAALTPILRNELIGAEAAETIIEAEIAKRMPEMVASWMRLLVAMEKHETVI